MSFKFDKDKPEDFGLTKSKEKKDIFICEHDNSEWICVPLYDFGWGNEYGFMRLPMLKFMELWSILENTSIHNNKYGAAAIIENEYADEMLNYLLELTNDPQFSLGDPLKEALKILDLGTIKNRSETLGKTYKEISEEFKNWKLLGERISKLIAGK